MLISTPDPSITVRGIEHTSELDGLHRWLGERRGHVLGIDCESNAEDQFDPRYRLRSVQVADPFESWVIPAETLHPERVVEVVRPHLRWVAHFSEADIRFLHRGAPGSVRVTEDTPHIVDSQTALAWYDPRTVTSQDDAYGKIPLPKGLKPSVARVLGTEVMSRAENARDLMAASIAPKGTNTKDGRLRHWFANVSLSDPTFQVYAGLDPLYGVRLWHVMTEEIRRRGQWPGFVDDLALQWQIDLMTLRGMPTDGEYAVWLDGQFQAAIEQHAAELARVGVPPSGMGASVGVAFERLGVSPRKFNKRADGSSEPSWDKHVLAELLAEGGPAGELAARITAVRKATKFRSAYIRPMLLAAMRDGRMHPSMRAVGTITSRQSAANPPAQQLPKKDPRVRAAITAPPGWSIVSCDLSQGEPRTMAALSGDRNLLSAILAGDLNSTTASAVYGDQYDPAHGHDAGTPHYLMRQGGKIGFLAWCYGAQDKKLAESLAKDQAPGIAPITSAPSAAWRGDFPDLARLQDDLNSRRWIELPNGWIAPLWDAHFWDAASERITYTGRASRKGLNYATQGTQRQLLAAAVRRLVAAGWGWALMMLVHDEIVLLVPSWMAEAARDALKAAMTMTYRGVPIECEAEICGQTWLPRPVEFDASARSLLALADESEAVL